MLDATQLPTRRHLQDKDVYEEEEEEIISLVDLAAKNYDVDDQLVPGKEAIDENDNTEDTDWTRRRKLLMI